MHQRSSDSKFEQSDFDVQQIVFDQIHGHHHSGRISVTLNDKNKFNMNVQEQKKRAAILLRYQTDKPSKESKVYRTYATIARAL